MEEDNQNLHTQLHIAHHHLAHVAYLRHKQSVPKTLSHSHPPAFIDPPVAAVMATIWRGVAAGFSNRSTSHLVVRLYSQTGQDCSVMRPRASPWIVNSCYIRVSKLSQGPLAHMKKKCFLPSIVACLQGPGGMEPEEPDDDLPDIVESSPDEMMSKKAANGAADNKTGSDDDFTSSESDSRLTRDEDTNNWNQLPVGIQVGLPVLEVLLKVLKSQGAILNYVKEKLVSNYEQEIFTVVVTLVWIKAFYDLGLN